MNIAIEPGIYPDIPNEAYHAGPGVSKSGLWELHTKSPYHFQFAPREEKNFFDLGEAGHIAALQPEQFEALVYRGPDDRRGNKWTDAQEFCKIEGKVCLTSKDYDKALMIRDTLHADPTINSLVASSAAQVEASGFWTDAETGSLCRCRPDLYRPDLSLIVDLKTTTSAHPGKFARSVVDYGYHAQEAFYTDGLRALGQSVNAFVFIAVEKTDPFAFAIYELPPSIVDEGRAIMRKALDKYAECKRTDTWPGYANGVQELQFPRWAYTETQAPVGGEE
jgi:exodeoxyribonuclease VIII